MVLSRCGGDGAADGSRSSVGGIVALVIVTDVGVGAEARHTRVLVEGLDGEVAPYEGWVEGGHQDPSLGKTNPSLSRLKSSPRGSISQTRWNKKAWAKAETSSGQHWDYGMSVHFR